MAGLGVQLHRGPSNELSGPITSSVLSAPTTLHTMPGRPIGAVTRTKQLQTGRPVMECLHASVLRQMQGGADGHTCICFSEKLTLFEGRVTNAAFGRSSQ